MEDTTYAPHGAIESGGTAVKHLYTGQEYDHSTGLSYYQARYYHPYLRRFTQPDTLIPNAYDPQSLNPYAYARNNPIKYTDPSGHSPALVLLIAAWVAIDYGITGYDLYQEQRIINNPNSTLDQVNEAKKSQQDILAYEFLLEPDEVVKIPILGPIDDVMRKSKALRNVEQDITEEGFSSFNRFKKEYGKAGDGQAWHHVVEQNANNIEKFGAGQIHNTQNLIQLPNEAGNIHRQITGFYNSSAIRYFDDAIKGQRVRDYIKNWNFKDQYNFGIKAIIENGGQKYLNDAGLHYIN